ncbi:hypothetical protein FF100_22190 [Methylobacterium terricola]|uniref:Uncharacterized protein n=1 Tax=Methylobacterium terricola TaxID=2583531 RepID=A0A5C4LDR5_9HYPH|nr:hypothetical protein [Methylobacterium terricola]TNC10864.1 hypothetical protein FF100_22190 [Methylobacterium terricola]
MTISESDLKALTDYVAELEAENDFLSRERLLLVGGPQALAKIAPGPILRHTGPIPEGCGIGNAGQLICLTHAAARKHSVRPEWFEPTPMKRARKPGGEGL